MRIDYIKFQKAMSAAAMTNIEVAYNAGVSLGLIDRLKSMKNDTRLENIGKIAYALGVDVEDIILSDNEEGIKTMKLNANKLQVAIARSCKTRKAISDETGLNPVTIDNLIHGRTKGQMASIGLMARCLNVAVEEIVDFE